MCKHLCVCVCTQTMYSICSFHSYLKYKYFNKVCVCVYVCIFSLFTDGIDDINS